MYRARIRRFIKMHDGDRVAAANSLGITKSRLKQMLYRDEMTKTMQLLMHYIVKENEGGAGGQK